MASEPWPNMSVRLPALVALVAISLNSAAESAADWAGLLFRVTNPLLFIFGKPLEQIATDAIDEILAFLEVDAPTLEAELGIGRKENLASRWLGFGFDLPLPSYRCLRRFNIRVWWSATFFYLR